MGTSISIFRGFSPASTNKVSTLINQPCSPQYPGSFYPISSGVATIFQSSITAIPLGYISLYLVRNSTVTSGNVQGRIYLNSADGTPGDVIAQGGFSVDAATLPQLSSPTSLSISLLGQLDTLSTYWLVLTSSTTSDQLYVYCADSPASAQSAVLTNNTWTTIDNRAIYFLLKSTTDIAGAFHSDGNIAVSATSDVGTALYAESSHGFDLDCASRFRVKSDGSLYSKLKGVLISPNGSEIKGYIPSPLSSNPQAPIYDPITDTWAVRDIPNNITNLTGLQSLGVGTSTPGPAVQVTGGVAIASTPDSAIDPGVGNLIANHILAKSFQTNPIAASPSYSSDEGKPGEIRACSDGLYVCTEDGWGKAALTLLPNSSGLDLDTLNFQNRAKNNGGNFSNSATIPAVDAFVKNLKADGLWDLLTDVTIYAGDNLASAITKLKYSAGMPSSYINNGFTDNDYSENTGLRGGSNKYLDSGVTASSLDPNSAYLAGYVSGDCSGQTSSFFGTPYRPTNNEDNFKLYINYQGNVYGGLFFDQINGQQSAVQGGFYAISKISDQDAFFQVNDAQNSIVVSTKGRVEPILFFVDRGGYFDKALKFSCIASGLSLPQSLALKSRVLAFQQALSRA